MKRFHSNMLLTLLMGAAAACLLSPPVNAQVRLTGANTYMARQDGSALWGVNNTLGSSIVNYYNLYLFTGSPYAPNWLNWGDTDDSLNPNLTLSPGTYTIQFTGDSMGWDNLGLNLYFEDNLTSRITAFAPRDGKGVFQMVPDGMDTIGQLGHVLSSGSLTYVLDNTIVELTDLRFSIPGINLVSPYGNYPGGFSAQDAIGSFTLRVSSAVPVTVVGTVSLEGYSVQKGHVFYPKGVPLSFRFQPVNGGQPFFRTLYLGAEGTFTLNDIPAQPYQVWIKGDKWLAKSVPIDITKGRASTLKALLLAGDANNDNFVDVLDLDMLIRAFDSEYGDPNWSEGADFNGDGAVDGLDLDLLLRNFDTAGDF